jgi:hypothetical protein
MKEKSALWPFKSLSNLIHIKNGWTIVGREKRFKKEIGKLWAKKNLI